MGNLMSYWKRDKTTVEKLEKIDKDIKALEQVNRGNLEKQKKFIGALIIYSIFAYIVAAISFYFFYSNEATLTTKTMYATPLGVFPILIWFLKKILKWYFVKRISETETKMIFLKEKRTLILDSVMENETYKKANEILKRFSPEIHDTPIVDKPQSKVISQVHSKDLRQRRKPTSTPIGRPMDSAFTVPAGSMTTPAPRTDNRPPHQPHSTRRSQSANQRQLFTTNTPAYKPQPPAMPTIPAPGPPAPRNIPHRDRTTMEVLLEYMLGESPKDRFALICKSCNSHNGMMSAEKFPYTAFRCCYCYVLNESEKIRPQAPSLHVDASAEKFVNFTEPSVKPIAIADSERMQTPFKQKKNTDWPSKKNSLEDCSNQDDRGEEEEEELTSSKTNTSDSETASIMSSSNEDLKKECKKSFI